MTFNQHAWLFICQEKSCTVRFCKPQICYVYYFVCRTVVNMWSGLCTKPTCYALENMRSWLETPVFGGTKAAGKVCWSLMVVCNLAAVAPFCRVIHHLLHLLMTTSAHVWCHFSYIGVIRMKPSDVIMQKRSIPTFSSDVWTGTVRPFLIITSCNTKFDLLYYKQKLWLCSDENYLRCKYCDWIYQFVQTSHRPRPTRKKTNKSNLNLII